MYEFQNPSQKKSCFDAYPKSKTSLINWYYQVFEGDISHDPCWWWFSSNWINRVRIFFPLNRIQWKEKKENQINLINKKTPTTTSVILKSIWNRIDAEIAEKKHKLNTQTHRMFVCLVFVFVCSKSTKKPR